MERNQKVMKRVQEHYDYLIARGYNVAFVALQGSQNYKMDIYSDEYMSDVDTKAIIIPTFDDIVAGKMPYSTTLILENNEHIDVKDIRVMFEMFKKQNISYLELLFTEFKVVNPIYQELCDALFASADGIAKYNNIAFFKALKGMAYEKQKALQHPYPNTLEKIEKFGYDPKQLHHIVRLWIMCEDLISGVPLRYAFVPEEDARKALVEIKLGAFTEEEAVDFATFAVGKISQLCDEECKVLSLMSGIAEILHHLCKEFIAKSVRIELGV